MKAHSNLPSILHRAHERYRQTDDRQTTDGRAIAYSEREREFMFANYGRSITVGALGGS